MTFRSPRERRLWGAAAALLLLLYLTLYWIRPVSNYFRDRGLVWQAVALAFAAVGAVVAWRVARSRPGWREALAVAAFVPFYATLLWRMHRPEEAFHFVEYGLFAGLVYLALAERWRIAPPQEAARPGRRSPPPRWAPWVGAVALTAAAGWLDEGIQGLLPGRYYDLRDVGFNIAAGVAAATLLTLRGVARRRDRQARPDPRPDGVERR
jgi:hypothetical protein